MFAKVHPAKDVQSGNTGSCHDLVHYLQKEGDTGLAFFSHTDNDVSPEKVITDIGVTCTFHSNISPCVNLKNDGFSDFTGTLLSFIKK